MLAEPTAPVMCGQSGWAAASLSNTSSERKLMLAPRSRARLYFLFSIWLGT